MKEKSRAVKADLVYEWPGLLTFELYAAVVNMINMMPNDKTGNSVPHIRS
jgi:hypothetical protein